MTNMKHPLDVSNTFRKEGKNRWAVKLVSFQSLFSFPCMSLRCVLASCIRCKFSSLEVQNRQHVGVSVSALVPYDVNYRAMGISPHDCA